MSKIFKDLHIPDKSLKSSTHTYQAFSPNRTEMSSRSATYVTFGSEPTDEQIANSLQVNHPGSTVSFVSEEKKIEGGQWTVQGTLTITPSAASSSS